MIQFDCNSKLRVRPSLDRRTLNLRFRHNKYREYDDFDIPSEVQAFIDERVLSHSPTEIHEKLKDSGLPNVKKILPHQVNYQWKQSNKNLWKRNDDQILSAGQLLDEHSKSYHYDSFRVENCRALAFYFQTSIKSLARITKEVAIDATYGTNNSGMDLYALLAELDGTGVPLAYLFIKKESPKGTATPPGTLTQVLDRSLRPLKQSGLSPTFVDCDTDRSEINAVEQVWPFAKVQLCF